MIRRGGDAQAAEALCREILAYASATLSPERLRHSVAVADLAAELCVRHGLDPVKGRLAGLGHDIAREYTPEASLEFLRRHRIPAGRWERAHPVVLHGLVGREILKRRFGLRDREVLAAVRDHVLGRPRLGRLACILYAADFLEPGRGFLPESERRAVLALPLEAAVVRVTGEIFGYLERAGQAIAPVTKKMYDRLKSGLKERGA